MDADPAILIIDFEGLGKTAYEFTVTLSGAKRDSIILNQTDLSRDWTRTGRPRQQRMRAAGAPSGAYPGRLAPEGAVNGDKRTIGIYAAATSSMMHCVSHFRRSSF